MRRFVRRTAVGCGGVSQDMQAEAGRTIERRSGTRAATTFRKLPSASPGAKATAAREKFTLRLSAAAVPDLRDQPLVYDGGSGAPDVFGLPGAPSGRSARPGSGFICVLCPTESVSAMSGPSVWED